jgi:hypothetical protein
MKVVGDITCQGAVFIYKADDTAGKAWDDVEEIYKSSGAIRGELHDTKSPLLAGLKEWNEAVDPSNAFLCLYAHMGRLGINCFGESTPNVVTWRELQTALPRGVELLWLVGCNSQECLQQWNSVAMPVRHLLLATSESKPWRPLLKCFAAEIDIKHIRFYDEMPSYLASVQPELAGYTEYFRPSQNGFVTAF